MNLSKLPTMTQDGWSLVTMDQGGVTLSWRRLADSLPVGSVQGRVPPLAGVQLCKL